MLDRARTDLRPTGPGGLAAPVNLKAKRMRMVLPQVLKLAPPMDVYDPVRADEDRKTWQQVRAMCDRMLEMYDQMPVHDPGRDRPASTQTQRVYTANQ